LGNRKEGIERRKNKNYSIAGRKGTLAQVRLQKRTTVPLQAES